MININEIIMQMHYYFLAVRAMIDNRMYLRPDVYTILTTFMDALGETDFVDEYCIEYIISHSSLEISEILYDNTVTLHCSDKNEYTVMLINIIDSLIIEWFNGNRTNKIIHDKEVLYYLCKDAIELNIDEITALSKYILYLFDYGDSIYNNSITNINSF